MSRYLPFVVFCAALWLLTNALFNIYDAYWAICGDRVDCESLAPMTGLLALGNLVASLALAAFTAWFVGIFKISN